MRTYHNSRFGISELTNYLKVWFLKGVAERFQIGIRAVFSPSFGHGQADF